MTEVLPRRYKARYAASMADEIRKNVTLAAGEKIIHSQRVRERKSWLIAQPRLLAVTDLQMILLEHNLLSADWIVQIPRSTITKVSREESLMNSWVELTYFDNGESRTVRVQPMLRYKSEKANQELFMILSAFQSGQLNSLVGTQGVNRDLSWM